MFSYWYKFLTWCLFPTFAVVFWAFGVCGLHCSWHTRNSWEGTLWRSGLCEACSDLVYWFGCNFCPDSSYHGEFDSCKVKTFFWDCTSTFVFFAFLSHINVVLIGFSLFFPVEEFRRENWKEEEEERLIFSSIKLVWQFVFNLWNIYIWQLSVKFSPRLELVPAVQLAVFLLYSTCWKFNMYF